MRIERNIRRNYLFVFLSGTSFSEAIWMLYLTFRGMSLVQIGFIEAVFHVTSLPMEVPTGIIADRFGRKTSRLLGRLAGMLAAANAYRFEINPGTDFNYYETVTVNVSANDLAAVPNFMEDSFSFTTKSGYMKVTNNLFNPTLGGNQVSIEFAHFYEDGDVSVKLYTLSGEFIKMLYEDFKAKGLPAEFLAWDGKNVEDSTVASGIYLIHIEAPGFKDTKKVAIVK